MFMAVRNLVFVLPGLWWQGGSAVWPWSIACPGVISVGAEPPSETILPCRLDGGPRATASPEPPQDRKVARIGALCRVRGDHLMLMVRFGH